MKTLPAALAVAAIAFPAAQTPSATTNPPSTAVGSGTAKALEKTPATRHKAVHRTHKTNQSGNTDSAGSGR